MYQKIFKSILIFFAVGVIVFGGYFLWNGSLFGKALPTQNIQQGISPALPKPEKIALLEPEPTPQVVVINPQAPTPAPQPTIEPASPAEESDGKPVCGGPETMGIIALGIDENAQADAIRLVRVDFVNQKVTVLSIPRDFWVKVPDLAAYGVTEGRINATYGYGEYYLGRGEGIVSFTNTIYANYGITFDHYLVAHLDSFVKMIDDIGGVDITLDVPLDGRTQGARYFEAGAHHFDGATAMEFIRIRFPDTDAFRVDRQTQLAKIVFSKITDPANRGMLPGLGLQMLTDKSILTDLSLSDATKLACLATRIDQAAIEFLTIPREMYRPGTSFSGASILIPSAAMLEYVQGVWNGIQ